ncbi:MAG: AtpZ/AtpI family protein [Thermodesulfobacteriota bacterium]
MGGRTVKSDGKYKWLMFIAIGFELGFSVIAGILLGHYVDKLVGTKTPWFTILGLLAGGFAGFNILLRMIKRVNDGKDSESN